MCSICSGYDTLFLCLKAKRRNQKFIFIQLIADSKDGFVSHSVCMYVFMHVCKRFSSLTLDPLPKSYQNFGCMYINIGSCRHFSFNNFHLRGQGKVAYYFSSVLFCKFGWFLYLVFPMSKNVGTILIYIY